MRAFHCKPALRLTKQYAANFLPLMLLVFAMFFLPPCAPAKADEGKKDQYLLSANQIQNDDQNKIITAQGQVEIDNDGQILKADQVEFQQIKDTVSARGDVALLTKDKNTVFAKEATLSSNFVDGEAKEVGMLMADNSRFAAKDARRVNGRYMVFSRGLYSPCNLCTTDPHRAPLWQMKASKVTHDMEKKDLIYRDARLEVFDVPIFYTPYFSHPDPTVKRRQGLLTFKYGRSADLGFNVTTPYYFDIAPDADYTFKPNFNGTDGLRWAGTLRKRYEHGDIKIDHSLVVADRLDDDGIIKKDQLRGHIAGYAHFDLDNVFRTGADFAMLTDKNYMRRYGESLDDILTNRVFLEGFKGRQFGALEMFYFQDNRPGPRPEQPLVLPRMRLTEYGEPNLTLGGRWSFDGEVSALHRDTGEDVRKFATSFGWQRRNILPAGFVSTLDASVRDNIYWVDNMPSPDTPGRVYNGDVTNLLFPEGQWKISYPLAAYLEDFSHTIEPIVALSASPTRRLDPRIPNEDSVDLDFDTSNLFELSRYPGSDRQEQGVRAAYGFKTGFYNHTGGYGEFTLGQNYRITKDPNFAVGSGLDTRLSDYVGQLKLEPGTWLTLDYQFRLDKDKLKSHKHEVSTNFGVPEFRPRFTYTYSDPTIFVPGVSNRIEELRFGFSSSFAEFWTFSFDQTRDLRPTTDGPRVSSASLSYIDECLTASLSFTRDHTVRTGVQSGDTYFFRIYFKNLGGIDSQQK